MKHILIILTIITTMLSCAAMSETVELDPEIEQEIIESEVEEYDRIINLCEDVFHHQRYKAIYCMMVNFYAMNKSVRLYIEDVVTSDQYKDCHKAEDYYPEYQTFWYVGVLECLEKEISNE